MVAFQNLTFSPEFKQFAEKKMGPGFAKDFLFTDKLQERHPDMKLGDFGWNVNLATGTIDFNEQGKYPTQLLGTYAQGYWLWSWANSGSPIPQEAMKDALELQQYGREHAIRELTEPRLTLDKNTLTQLLTACLGQSSAHAWFGGNTGSIIAGMFIRSEDSPALETLPSFDIMRVVSRIPYIDHGISARQTIKSFLLAADLRTIEQGNDLVAVGSGGFEWRVKFDDYGRMTSTEGMLSLDKEKKDNLNPKPAGLGPKNYLIPEFLPLYSK